MKYLFLIITLALSINGFAQKQKEAEDILKAAADKALAYKTIYMKFNFFVNNLQNDSKDEYQGELWTKGNKFKISIDNSITYSNGKERWVYLKDENEVTVSTIDFSEDLDPEDLFLVKPLSIFTLYKKNFKYYISGDQNIDGKHHTVVELVPEDLNKPYFKIKCWISDDYDYYSIKYFQKDGIHIILQLTDFKTDIKLKDSFFVFNSKEHPEVEIIDMRD